ncbi:MAG: ATP-binding protein [Kiritimatiellia bacterium]
MVAARCTYYAREHNVFWYNICMRFIDRVEEMERLARLVRERRGGFAAIWGRRRIGKSELLKEWCRRFAGLYTVADQSLPSMQRTSFALALSDHFKGFADVSYPSWKVLFEALSRRAAAEDWHGPLVMDEFPYWVEADAALPSVMQNWVDGEKGRHGIVCAIAGSVQHMMQGLVIDADSPLYGRVDEKIKLLPIGIDFVKEAFHLEKAVDAVKAYAIWGGVPRYWVAAERFGADIDRAVDELALAPLGIFHEEPAALLQSEIPNAMSLKPYLDAIGLGANRASEIAGRLGVPVTGLSRPLARLTEIGLVKREVPLGESEKNSKKSIYRLSDPFCRFWFSVMATRRSVFDSAPESVRLSVWRRYEQQVFSAAWEDLSRSFVARSKRLRHIAGKNGYWLPAGRWWHKTETEWDVVAANGDGTKVLLGEAKWSDKPFADKEIEIMAERIKHRNIPAGITGSPCFALFLASVGDRDPRMKICKGVEIVTADEVVAADSQISEAI